MPKDLPGQIQHCVEWITCPSPTALPYQSDKEDIDLHLLGVAFTELLSAAHIEEVEDEGGADGDDNEYGWD